MSLPEIVGVCSSPAVADSRTQSPAAPCVTTEKGQTRVAACLSLRRAAKTNLPNLFASPEVATRYRQARPFFHDRVAEQISAFSGRARFGRALDAGCRTGQSTLALAAIADSVVALDSSPAMLAHATPCPNVRYQLGAAEQLNFADGEFDLISVGSALHWFDPDRFFAQCRRVLSGSGLLAVYNDHFTTHMEAVASFHTWMRTSFARRFPVPRHGMRDIDEGKARAAGFEIAHRSSFNHHVVFSSDDLIAFLLTRSNTLAAIHAGKTTNAEVSEWLHAELATFLPDRAAGSFLFKCNLWLLRAAPETGSRITAPA